MAPSDRKRMKRRMNHESKVMNAMQSFSKALMGPVLFLPIAGMLQALSSVMCNTAFVSEVSYIQLENLSMAESAQ